MIELYTIPAGLPDVVDGNRPVVILDIFRASTSITAALACGASEVYVAGSRAEAADLKRQLGDDVILAGERGGYKIEGYDFGNSPREMTPGAVAGRRIIFNSTNGTRLMRRFSDHEQLAVGSLVALSATAEYCGRFKADPIICCAGGEGKFSAEDTLAAGLLISRLGRPERELDDAALSALRLVELSGGKWSIWAEHSVHGRKLTSLGFGEDLGFCLTVDKYDFIPIKAGEKIVKDKRSASREH